MAEVKEESKANKNEILAIDQMISMKEFEEETAEEVQGHHF